MRAQLTTNFTRARTAVQKGAERGILLAAEHVLQLSRDRVPIEEATLERSGVASSSGLTAAVSYDTPYAVRQHEELTWQHAEGRQAKYLESALIDSVDEVPEIVAAQVRRALR